MIRKYISVVLSFMLLLCGCSDGMLVEKEAKRRESTGESWTVMIYMSASTLEEERGRAGEVLNSLSFDLPENINVIIETGGCRQWKTEGMKNDRISDFEVQKNGLRLINEKLLSNMGESSTYADFLSRTMAKYPADRYMSVIWGEGGGVLDGVAHDGTYEFDSLSVKEISEALSLSGAKLDIIGFDASLMANLETASALSLYADYLVASEDIMPLSGWDYRALFDYISQNPSATGAQVGKIICDSTLALSENSAEPVIMSVTDLSQTSKLIQSFDTMARHMSTFADDTERLRRFGIEMNNIKTVGANTVWEGYSNLIDLASLSGAVFNTAGDDAARLENIISKTVIYKASDKMYEDSCGINVYYPIDMRVAQINQYKQICPSEGYIGFIDRICTNDLAKNRTADYKESAAWQHYSAVAAQNVISAKSDLNGYYVLSATNPEIISLAGVNLYKYDEEEGKYKYLFTDYDTAYSVDANGYIYELSNVQTELNGIAVSSYLINTTDDYEIYSIPVLHDEKISSLRVKKTSDGEKSEYKVLGLWEGKDSLTGIVSRGYKSLRVGDVVEPIYKVYGNEDEYIKGKRLKIVFGGLSVTEKSVKDGDYVMSYTVKDIYGLNSESETTAVTALKGKLKFSN